MLSGQQDKARARGVGWLRMRATPRRSRDQRRPGRSARLAPPERTRERARSRRAGTPMAARTASPSVDCGRRAAPPHGQATRSTLPASRSTTSTRPAPCSCSHRTATASRHRAPAVYRPNARVTGPTSTAPPTALRPGARPTTTGPVPSAAASILRTSHRCRRRPCRLLTSHPSSRSVVSCMRLIHAFSMPDRFATTDRRPGAARTRSGAPGAADRVWHDRRAP